MDAVRQRVEANSSELPGSVGRRLHVAVISDGFGVLGTYADWSPDGLLLRLARYLEERAPVTLWPGSARRVLDLLGSGEIDAAIRLYFDETGERWDKERLYQDVLELG